MSQNNQMVSTNRDAMDASMSRMIGTQAQLARDVDALLRNVTTIANAVADNGERISKHQMIIEELKERVDKRIYLAPHQAKKAQDMAKERLKLLAEQYGIDYYKERGKLFCALWGDVKDAFQVGTYREIPEVQFEALLHFIGVWDQIAKLLEEWTKPGSITA